jgi:MFS family permease
MERTDRLSGATRALTYVSAAAFVLMGIVLFVAPSWSAERFPWNVSPLVAMTIGGWCLGTAVAAWMAAGTWRWGFVYPLFVYLWSFAVLELAVVVWFGELVKLDVALAWPYIGTLALGLTAALSGVVDLVRLRPTSAAVGGGPVPRWVRGLVVMFVLFAGFVAAFAAASSNGTQDRVFPEPLSPFTVRAFGAFYLSLVLAAIPLIRARTMAPVTAFLIAGLALVLPITAATLMYVDRFDFGRQPSQALYLGTYVVAGAAALSILLWDRARRRGTPSGVAV